ncbi:MAG: FAD-dependent monooxygenase [Rhodospirillaceae bacterium]|nr:FAD-dependent monooxygenase [Rhodospirillaceae bacterium]
MIDMLRSIAIVGGGPAGLFLSILLKKAWPGCRVCVFEQNPREATYGFGIAIKRRIIDRFERYDPDSIALLRPHLVTYGYQIIALNGAEVRLDYADASASIERLRMLAAFQQIAEGHGIELVFDRRIEPIGDLARRHDLVVGADGANSVVRETFAAAFGTQLDAVRNPLAWYGTGKVFAHSGLSFRRTPDGNFIAHYYPYAADRSTFVVECDENTWNGRLRHMAQPERTALAERIFATELDGHPLIDNKSVWRNLAVASNRRWFAGNCVLVGDALRPAHPSIGSGTRLAIDDAIALFEALTAPGADLSAALPAYQQAREQTRAKLNEAMTRSYQWYERIDAKLDLPPEAFVHDYLTRTGRVDEARLARDYPGFMRRYAEFAGRNGRQAAADA